MNEDDFISGGKSRRGKANHHADEEVPYTSSSEERVLRSISSRVALPKVLNEICSVLDCQIGNVVSLISLPGDDAGDLAAIAKNAALFGLYTFCSEGVFDESDKLLGFLEMYSSVARRPNASRRLQSSVMVRLAKNRIAACKVAGQPEGVCWSGQFR
jgi:hypothetical protein